ncbi:MAG: molybdopterin-dependent oxidoreductase [Chloroflexota bacterium]
MADSENRIVRTGGHHDCGGCCPYLVHVIDGKARKIEPYPEPSHRTCARCWAYPSVVHHKDRLLYPLKRTGERGEGKFTRISWDEALDEVASRLTAIRQKYGPSCTMLMSASGSRGHVHSALSVFRLFNMIGGCLVRWGSASNESNTFASIVTYGTGDNGNSMDDLANSKLIIAWGWNPMETVQATGTPYFLLKAKEAGARIISVDPRFTNTAAVVADQWIPIRPGTDAAMLIAMAHVMITEGLCDKEFLDRCTVGFGQFSDYVLGKEDGIAKTPSWANEITGVASETIVALAREYATTKPAALIDGYGPGRTAYGEQYVRAAQALGALTGNIGISGGMAPGLRQVPGFIGGMGGARGPALPIGKNPLEPDLGGIKPDKVDRDVYNRYRICTANAWDALLNGKAAGYPADIKMLYIATVNNINQWPNTNRAIEAFKKMEFIVIHEKFMTATARYADIILPVADQWERTDYQRSWMAICLTPYYIYQNKVLDPPGEAKTDFQICCELAEKLGLKGYQEKTEDEWLRTLLSEPADTARDIPSYEEFKKAGIAYPKLEKPAVAFKDEAAGRKPFPTPSGKIEIYSERLAQLNKPEIPPIPKYIPTWENLDDALSRKYPFQLITPHFKLRAHSGFDNVPWFKELEPQTVWINSQDAAGKGIKNDDKVSVFNDRGKVIITAKVTDRIMPGVLAMCEGAWFSPDEHGIDHGGCPNLLTRDKPAPSGAIPYNTALVQIERE